MLFPFPSIKVTVTYGRVIDRLPKEVVVARILSDAVALNGFHYFWAVELGRRAMAAPTAAGKKALRWIGDPGTIAAFGSERFKNSVFSRSSAATRPRSIRRETLQEAVSIANSWEREYNATRASLVALVNRVAVTLAWILAKNTPKRTGKLSRSYTVEEAK